ncbi:DUF6228 family protein [Amycolatopsis sp., V23-08]|uniref:DUF6228 family protein n=1 Tax=Amycolatopsis heterodermiae TaxID=3110235 RepID=A0ABU5QXL1_9PSEU|nr:DUF6228 family protein [Amycolatopsis sp., V23-08]MEA5358673.1 DUF6228 family protein [Amycolatopsis sp., V23-08]
MTVSVEGPGVTVTLSNLDRSEGDLVVFSVRGDLELRAVHTGGVVELAWTLRGPESVLDRARHWECVARTFLTPGEELRRFSADVTAFLAT